MIKNLERPTLYSHSHSVKISRLLYLLLIAFSFACSKEKTFDCVKSTGDIEKENRYFENFSSLYVEDNIDVILVQSMPGRVVVEAGDNLLPKIKCVQEGNLLKIKNDNTCNWVRSYKKPINIYVGVDQVKEISQKGYGTIKEGEALKTDTLRIYNLTFGETDLTIEAAFIGFIADDHATFKLRGKAHVMAGSSFKNSLVNTEGMDVPWFYFISNSLTDSRIYCDSLAQVDINGEGKVYCKGKPSIVQYNHFGGKGELLFP